MQRLNQNPSVWGPSAWSFLDAVTAGYPDVAMLSEQMAMMGFLEGLGTALPCERCRSNFKRFAAEQPPGLAVWGKRGLAMWLSDLKQQIKEERR
jgi:Erv1 / Alr family